MYGSIIFTLFCIEHTTNNNKFSNQLNFEHGPRIFNDNTVLLASSSTEGLNLFYLRAWECAAGSSQYFLNF